MAAALLSACAPADADREATLRLLHSLFGDSATIVVGDLPPDVPPPLELPPGDRIVGTVARPGVVQIFVSSRLPVDTVGPAYGDRLVDRGWTFEGPAGGLRGSRGIEDLCRPDGRRLSLHYDGTSSGTADVRLDLYPADGRSCVAEDGDFLGVQRAVPRLFPPADGGADSCPGASVGPARSGPGGSAGGPRDVMGHVRSEMELPPWRRVDGASSLARSWTRLDDRGRPIRVTLTVTDGATPGCPTLSYAAGLLR